MNYMREPDAYKDDLHYKRFWELMKKGNVNELDSETSVLLFILASNDNLYNHASEIYNFIEKRLDVWVGEGTDVLKPFPYLSSSTERLLRLGMNFYNGYELNYSVLDIIGYLDDDNMRVFLAACMIRRGLIVLYKDRMTYQKDYVLYQYQYDKAPIFEVEEEAADEIKLSLIEPDELA